MQKEKYHLLANQYPQGKRTLQTSTRTEDKNTHSIRQKRCVLSDRQPKLPTHGQKTKIHAVLDKNTACSPTDNQSYQHADRRQKYTQYWTKTLYTLRQTTKVTNARTEDKNTCSTRRKHCISSNRQPKLLKRGQKTKIHAVLDENTLYSPTDNQSYHHTDRRQNTCNTRRKYFILSDRQPKFPLKELCQELNQNSNSESCNPV